MLETDLSSWKKTTGQFLWLEVLINIMCFPQSRWMAKQCVPYQWCVPLVVQKSCRSCVLMHDSTRPEARVSGTCMTFARSKLPGQLSKKRRKVEFQSQLSVEMVMIKLAAKKYGKVEKKQVLQVVTSLGPTNNLFRACWLPPCLGIKRSRLEEAGRCYFPAILICSQFPFFLQENQGHNKSLGVGFKYYCYFHPYLGKWSNLSSIFLRWGWQKTTN